MDTNIRDIFRKTVEQFSPAEKKTMEERCVIMMHSREPVSDDDAFLMAVEDVFLARYRAEKKLVQVRDITACKGKKNKKG